MRGVVMHEAGDVRVEERDDPRLLEPTDAVIRLSATCICGSDLWPYRGAEPVEQQVMGHEYVGVVEQVGSEVRTVKPGDFVVGSFWASDKSIRKPDCSAGFSCAITIHTSTLEASLRATSAFMALTVLKFSKSKSSSSILMANSFCRKVTN